MLFKLARVLPALALALVVTTPAYAQRGGGGNGGQNLPNGGKMPTKEEINAKVQELLKKCDTQTAELEGFGKLTYKAIPSSPDEVAKTLGDEYKAQLPKGVDIEAFLKQYGQQIQDSLNEYLTTPEGWKFEAYEDLKWKSKKIPKGEYKVSVVCENEVAAKIVFSQDETKDEKGKKKAAVQLPINFAKVEAKQEQPFAKLKFELTGVEDKKVGKTLSFDIHCEFFRTKVKTNEAVKLDPPKDAPKKDDAKKDDTKKDDAKKDDGK
jgi:hypothetical protein